MLSCVNGGKVMEVYSYPVTHYCHLIGKLALCREERQRILDEETGKVPKRSKPAVVKSKKSVLVPAKTRTRKAKLSAKKPLSKSGT